LLANSLYSLGLAARGAALVDPIFDGIETSSRSANDDPCRASQHQINAQAEVLNEIATGTESAFAFIRCCLNALSERRFDGPIRPHRFAERDSEANFESSAAVRLARAPEVIEIRHHDIGRTDQFDVRGIYPSRSVMPSKRGGHLPVEWIETNEAAIAAELLQMLAMFLRSRRKTSKPAR
jgi:hypothetical protein